MNDKLTIPIVLSADDSYVPMLGTAIYSVIFNASRDFAYKIYILYTDISEANRSRLKTLETDYAEIIPLDISSLMDGIPRETSRHLSIETIYRLFIPELLQQYRKVLYLDSDLVVTGDISKLYQYDIGEYLLGVVRDISNRVTARHNEEDLGLSAWETFNAGVLLINTEYFQVEKIKEKCLALLQEDWKREKKKYIYMDQDVLNIVCHQKVCFLPMQWNLMWMYETGHCIPMDDVCREEYQRAKDDVKIWHFAGGLKPWNYPEYRNAEQFWRYARQTIFYEEALKQMTIEASNNLFTRYAFPFDIVKRRSKVIIYGAGAVGNAYMQQMKTTKYCTVVLWVDKKYKELQKMAKSVSSPEAIQNTVFDSLVIAVEQKELAQAIREELLSNGVPENKILWEEPC